MSESGTDVVLVQPEDGGMRDVLAPWLPLGLLSAASVAVDDGVKARIIDLRHNTEWQTELALCLEQGPVCVGITAQMGHQIESGLQVSRFVKQRSQVPVVWGGPHPTILPEQTLESPFIDVVVRGEGEITFAEVVRRLSTGKSLHGLEGVSFKDGHERIHNADREPANLASLPQLPYHLVNVRQYQTKYFGTHGVIMLESSRGCPYNCKFCYNSNLPFGKWRGRSVEHVLATVKYFIEAFSVRAFHFLDDNFFADPRRAMQIIEGIVQLGLDVKLGFQGVTINTIMRMDDEEIGLLARAGCRLVQLGVETGSPRMMELVGKRFSVDDVLLTTEKLARFPQIMVHYNFISGMPTEARDDLFMTVDLINEILRRNHTALVRVYLYVPLPGTALHDLAVQEGYEPPGSLEEWGSCDCQKVTRMRHGRGFAKLCRNVMVASLFVDRKVEVLSDRALMHALARIYRPIARFRFKRKLFHLMPEARLL